MRHESSWTPKRMALVAVLHVVALGPIVAQQCVPPANPGHFCHNVIGACWVTSTASVEMGAYPGNSEGCRVSHVSCTRYSYNVAGLFPFGLDHGILIHDFGTAACAVGFPAVFRSMGNPAAPPLDFYLAAKVFTESGWTVLESQPLFTLTTAMQRYFQRVMQSNLVSGSGIRGSVAWRADFQDGQSTSPPTSSLFPPMAQIIAIPDPNNATRGILTIDGAPSNAPGFFLVGAPSTVTYPIPWNDYSVPLLLDLSQPATFIGVQTNALGAFELSFPMPPLTGAIGLQAVVIDPALAPWVSPLLTL